MLVYGLPKYRSNANYIYIFNLSADRDLTGVSTETIKFLQNGSQNNLLDGDIYRMRL